MTLAACAVDLAPSCRCSRQSICPVHHPLDPLTTGAAVMKIAIDIDSTLHHYWDAFAAAAKRRFGVDLPYEHQVHLGTSSRSSPSSSTPASPRRTARRRSSRPSRTRAPSRPSRAGTSRATGSTSRATARRAPTTRPPRWLERIGLPYDDLHCSYDKVTRAREIGIDLLVDDSPVNLAAGHRRTASSAPTLVHPWNRDLIEEEDVVAADDWPELERKLAPFLADDAPAPTSTPAASLLPAIEPERRITDWGRSERIEGLLDRTLYDFLYHLWFRCEVRGDRERARPRAARCSSPTTPAPCRPTRAMIAKAIKEEHPRPRPLHLTIEHFFKGYPGLQHAAAEDRRRARAPGQRAAPARRRGAARARLPRGPQGHREALQGPLPPAPLRPRRLRQGRAAGAGADRADRASSAPRRPSRSSRTSTPLAADHRPDLRAAQRRSSTCRRSSRSASSSRSRPHELGERAHEDRGLVQTIAQDIRARIQEELFDMVGKRDSVWFG